jgi:hypothetical protein
MMAILFCAVLFVQRNSSGIGLRQNFFSAMVVGSVATAKFSLMPLTVAIAIVFGIQKFVVSQIGVFQRFNLLVVSAGGYLLSLIPFYGWKWVNYGNPAWPLFNKVFMAPGAPFENIRFNLPYSGMDYFDFLISPITAVIDVSKWGEEAAPGSYNAIFSIIVVSAILSVICYRKSTHKVLLTANIAFLFIWFINFRYSRYLLHIFPISIIAILSLVEELKRTKLAEKLITKNFLANLSIVSVGLLCAASFTISNPANPERIPYEHIFSKETKNEYLNKTSANFRLIENLNKSLPKNASIVSPQLFERVWLRSDLKLYHFWESNKEISGKSWKIFVSETPIYPEEFYACRDSVNFEFFTINPPSCEKDALTADPNS